MTAVVRCTSSRRASRGATAISNPSIPASAITVFGVVRENTTELRKLYANVYSRT